MLYEEPEAPKREENLVPLINIVFLMLIFFLITTTLKPFEKQDVDLAVTKISEDGKIRRDVFLLRKNGTVERDGLVRDLEAVGTLFDEYKDANSSQNPLLIVPDKDLDAEKLIGFLDAARKTGINFIQLVTERNGGS